MQYIDYLLFSFHVLAKAVNIVMHAKRSHPIATAMISKIVLSSEGDCKQLPVQAIGDYISI
jgi:hypothetical protein